MKYLGCIKCGSTDLDPPSTDEQMWTCIRCGEEFDISRKDAKKIWKRAEKEDADLGRYEPHILRLILNKQH